MDENTNEQGVDEVIEEETPETELTSDTDWEAEAKKARGIAQRLRTKLIKATEAKKAEVKVESKVEPVKEVQNTGGLDETHLDYLDLKGISEPEDIKIVEDIVKKTGMTVREALKDEYVIKKLESNKANREVKNAIPSSTRRTGGQTNDLATAIAKYEQSGYTVLPDDFALRSEVINALAAKANTNKPSWG